MQERSLAFKGVVLIEGLMLEKFRGYALEKGTEKQDIIYHAVTFYLQENCGKHFALCECHGYPEFL